MQNNGDRIATASRVAYADDDLGASASELELAAPWPASLSLLLPLSVASGAGPPIPNDPASRIECKLFSAKLCMYACSTHAHEQSTGGRATQKKKRREGECG